MKFNFIILVFGLVIFSSLAVAEDLPYQHENSLLFNLCKDNMGEDAGR